MLRPLNEVLLKILFSDNGNSWLFLELKEKNSILDWDVNPGLQLYMLVL